MNKGYRLLTLPKKWASVTLQIIPHGRLIPLLLCGTKLAQTLVQTLDNSIYPMAQLVENTSVLILDCKYFKSCYFVCFTGALFRIKCNMNGFVKWKNLRLINFLELMNDTKKRNQYSFITYHNRHVPMYIDTVRETSAHTQQHMKSVCRVWLVLMV
jgi:hypothetical protein